MYNLLEEKWISVRCKSGTIRWIAPHEIVDRTDPPVAFCSVRPDFEGSLAQFLIGLLQTACTPDSNADLRAWYQTPPTVEELKDRFAWMKPAFFLDGDGPRFMQDQALSSLASSAKEPCSIGSLLIELPGEQTLKLNKDFFIKRDQIHSLGFPAAATALLTLQLNAPSGGQGHRTSLRGGGPITTLIQGKTLWETVWLNVLKKESFLGTKKTAQVAKIEDVFPWMVPLRTSAHDETVTLLDVHPAQVFWATPRRIFLSFSPEAVGTCDLFKTETTPLVSSYITKNYGPNYKGAWRHPLTPYSTLPDGTLNPKKGQPDGFPYRDWPGMTLTQNKDKFSMIPAQVILDFSSRYQDEEIRLWMFGYDMDNMKARGYYSAVRPLLPVLLSDEEKGKFTRLVYGCVEASEEVRQRLTHCIKVALWENPKEAKGDFSFLAQEFWSGTESVFFATVEKLYECFQQEKETNEVCEAWLKNLHKVAVHMFDRHSQANADFQVANIARIAKAHNQLQGWVSPQGKGLRALVGL